VPAWAASGRKLNERRWILMKIKNLIISGLITTIISMVAPFRQATTLECVIWFVVMTGQGVLAMANMQKKEKAGTESKYQQMSLF
jgi:hypothetical protein